MRIRYYHPEDDPALMTLERLSPRGLPEPFIHYRRRFIDRAALFSDHQLLIAEHDSQVIGCAALAVKRTQVGGRPVSLSYIFDVRTHPTFRRHGVGTALVEAAEEYLVGREIDGIYGHIESANVASLRLFAKQGYERVRQILMLFYQPFPAVEFPDIMPRHIADYVVDHDMVEAIHSTRDLYVPDVAERVKDFGFERWTIDLGNSRFSGLSLFDQSFVFQQWPAHLPFPTEEEMRTRGNRSIRIFDEVGMHAPHLLKMVFDIVRDLAVTLNANKVTLLLDRMDPAAPFLFSEAYKQMDYWMVFKSLNPDWIPEWQDGPIYTDAREL